MALHTDGLIASGSSTFSSFSASTQSARSSTASSFKIGSQVRLKSGGPHMTVSEIETMTINPRIHTCWFDMADNLCRAVLPPSALEPAQNTLARQPLPIGCLLEALDRLEQFLQDLKSPATGVYSSMINASSTKSSSIGIEGNA